MRQWAPRVRIVLTGVVLLLSSSPALAQMGGDSQTEPLQAPEVETAAVQETAETVEAAAEATVEETTETTETVEAAAGTVQETAETAETTVEETTQTAVEGAAGSVEKAAQGRDATNAPAPVEEIAGSTEEAVATAQDLDGAVQSSAGTAEVRNSEATEGQGSKTPTRGLQEPATVQASGGKDGSTNSGEPSGATGTESDHTIVAVGTTTGEAAAARAGSTTTAAGMPSESAEEGGTTSSSLSSARQRGSVAMSGPAVFMPMIVVKANDADGDGTFTDSEIAPLPSATVQFRVTIRNVGSDEVVVIGVRDVFSDSSGNSERTVCSDLVGSSIGPGETVICRFSLEDYAPAPGGRMVNTFELAVTKPSDFSWATVGDISVVQTAEERVLGITFGPGFGSLAETGASIAFLIAVMLVLAGTGDSFLQADRWRAGRFPLSPGFDRLPIIDAPRDARSWSLAGTCWTTQPLPVRAPARGRSSSSTQAASAGRNGGRR